MNVMLCNCRWQKYNIQSRHFSWVSGVLLGPEGGAVWNNDTVVWAAAWSFEIKLFGDYCSVLPEEHLWIQFDSWVTFLTKGWQVSWQTEQTCNSLCPGCHSAWPLCCLCTSRPQWQVARGGGVGQAGLHHPRVPLPWLVKPECLSVALQLLCLSSASPTNQKLIEAARSSCCYSNRQHWFTPTWKHVFLASPEPWVFHGLPLRALAPVLFTLLLCFADGADFYYAWYASLVTHESVITAGRGDEGKLQGRHNESVAMTLKKMTHWSLTGKGRHVNKYDHK